MKTCTLRKLSSLAVVAGLLTAGGAYAAEAASDDAAMRPTADRVVWYDGNRFPFDPKFDGDQTMTPVYEGSGTLEMSRTWEIMPYDSPEIYTEDRQMMSSDQVVDHNVNVRHDADHSYQRDLDAYRNEQARFPYGRPASATQNWEIMPYDGQVDDVQPSGLRDLDVRRNEAARFPYGRPANH